MFGYIRPLRSELKLREDERYRAAYCGLCRALGKRYGLLARFMVNYDLTFLYLLLSSVEPQSKCGRCVCPANIFCRKAYEKNERVYDFVTDVNVLLCSYKLRDNIADVSFFRGIGYRIASLATRSCYKKAAQRQPKYDALTRESLERLSQLEQEKSASIDRTADTFASLLCGCADYFDDAALQRPTQQVLYHVGRFLYLVDALDDLKRDVKRDDYNPLRYRFSVTGGKLNEADLQYFRNILDGSVSLAGAAYELLPEKSAVGILKNIIYLGMPAVLQQVSDGTFREKKRVQ